jgi:hypothetical protein
MNEAPYIKLPTFYCAIILIKEALAALVNFTGRKDLPSGPDVHLFGPVCRLIEGQVQNGAGMPLLAIAALPSQSCKSVEGYRRANIADSRSLVTLCANGHDFAEARRDIVPSIVSFADDFTVIAPCIGKGMVLGGVVAIEAET